MDIFKKLGSIQHLQSTSEIELFNIIKNKKINVSSFPTIIIYDTDSFAQIKAKFTSKTWYNTELYYNNILTANILIYIDYTSNVLEAYTISVSTELTPCDINPIISVGCISTNRSDQLGNPIDEVIPSVVVQEASKSLIPTSDSLSLAAIVIGIGIVLYLITKQKS